MNHNTETALFCVTDDIRLAIDKNQCTILILFDFSKAFECVNHRLLIAKLKALGFSPGVLSWVESHLRDRRQCVRVGDMCSQWMTLFCGVPQGSILGPLLFSFSLYVNDIGTALRTLDYQNYADDLQINCHTSLDQFDDTVQHINSKINDLVKWTEINGLKLNSTKTQPIT